MFRCIINLAWSLPLDNKLKKACMEGLRSLFATGIPCITSPAGFLLRIGFI